MGVTSSCVNEGAPRELDSFQRSLLDRTGLPWSFGSEGEVVMDVDNLPTDVFVELLGAGCFTYHLETVVTSVKTMHDLQFQVALKHAKKFVQESDIQYPSGSVLKATLVVQKFIGGLNILAHPIFKDGVDTGMFKVVWGDA